LWDFNGPLFVCKRDDVPDQSTRATYKSIDGSMEECSPATRAIRVRFPVDAPHTATRKFFFATLTNASSVLLYLGSRAPIDVILSVPVHGARIVSKICVDWPGNVAFFAIYRQTSVTHR
jgi:hypothetical protein